MENQTGLNQNMALNQSHTLDHTVLVRHPGHPTSPPGRRLAFRCLVTRLFVEPKNRDVMKGSPSKEAVTSQQDFNPTDVPNGSSKSGESESEGAGNIS